MARLFVAALPPEEVLDQLDGLERPAVAGVRYTTRAQWHVTLRFLGEADPARAAVALSALDAPAARAVVGPEVRRLGRGVVVAPVTGLESLAGEVVSATWQIGDPPEPRPFRGHLTLARLRGSTRCPLVGTTLGATFAVREVVLVRSHLGPRGARYEPLASFPLRSGEPPPVEG